tara:strand:+ start:27060 stop:27962 length:903 start_codon:yes stop_codon:yes gene_type:complete
MKNITIIGIGLIGSSIARVIREINKDVVINIVDNSNTALEKSKKLSLGNNYFEEMSTFIDKTEIIFICTPISAYKSIFEKLKKFRLSNETIITDVGSCKTEVIKNAQNILTKNMKFVPAHPIAGTEQSGPESGFTGLFNNKWLIITPCKNADDKSIKIISNLWKSFGCKIQMMDMNDHDSIMAITSHIPHIIAYNIVGTASELEDHLKEEVIKYSASGFRDFTRIASSDPTMWRDIILSNKEPILKMLKKFEKDLNGLKNAIINDDKEKLFRIFDKTRDIRKRIIEEGQDVKEPNFGRKN